MKRCGRMACADVATKAKATAINLIIIFLHLYSRPGSRPHRGWNVLGIKLDVGRD
jgi:hypothetical protein